MIASGVKCEFAPTATSSGRVDTTPVSWACLDGISFPTEGATYLHINRQDILRIDQFDSLEGTSLGGKRYLFHFTKASSINAILRSGTLRLSSFSTLNDPWEATHWAFTVVSPEGALAPMQAVEIGREMSALLKEGSRVVCFCSDGYPLQIERDLEIFETSGWARATMWAHSSFHTMSVSPFFRVSSNSGEERGAWSWLPIGLHL